MTYFGNLKRGDVFTYKNLKWQCLGKGQAMCQDGTIRDFNRNEVVEIDNN